MSRSIDDDMELIDEILNMDLSEFDDVEECDFCGTRLSFGHTPNHETLTMEEVAKCSSCGHLERRKKHNIC